MSLYADAEYPISADTETFHTDQLLSYARPGSWGTAAQKIAIGQHAKHAATQACKSR